MCGFVCVCVRRAVVVFRPAADTSELELLLCGALGREASSEQSRALTAAYHDLMSKRAPLLPNGLLFRRRYGLRDFYNFGRYLSRHGGRSLDNHEVILEALERNFNGGSPVEFSKVATRFFAELVKITSDDEADDEDRFNQRGFELFNRLHPRPVVDVLRNALLDQNVKLDGKRLNETITRYQLILDESADDSAARLLFQYGILDRNNTHVYDLSDFPDDRNDEVRSMMISRIKRAMMMDVTVLLMHTAPIHGSLYDLLNQHFTKMAKRDEIVYYANVAVGSYSRPCPVCDRVVPLVCAAVSVRVPWVLPQIHPKFRLIVHLSTSVKAPAPFYNRFEKYLITVNNVWGELKAHARMTPEDKDTLLLVCILHASDHTLCP